MKKKHEKLCKDILKSDVAVLSVLQTNNKCNMSHFSLH